MKIDNDPILIGDSIVFKDKEGIFIYSQNRKKVVLVNDFIVQKLQEKGFLLPLSEKFGNYSDNKKSLNLMLLLGNKCIMGCRYCYANGGATNNEMMSFEIAEKAVEQYINMEPDCKRITLFGGGEPTLNIDVIRKLIDKYQSSFSWILTTSGVVSQNFLRWLINKNVNITFSIDGPSFIQNKLRPLRNGEQSSHIVERSMRIWKNESCKPLSVRTTLTNETSIIISDILEYFNQIGVDTVHIEPLYNIGRAIESAKEKLFQCPTLDNWVNAVIIALKWAKNNKKRVRIGELIYFLNPGVSSYCSPMRGRTIVVNHRGEITTCSEVVDDNNENWKLFHIGKLGSKFDFDNERFKFLANRTVDNMEFCKNCFAKYLCRGGCAHKALTGAGDLFSQNSFHCAFMKRIIPLLIKRMVIGEYKF